MKRTIAMAGLIVALGFAIKSKAGQSQSQGGQQQSMQQSTQQTTQQPTPQVKVGPALTSKANSPTPAPTAQNKTQKTSIGKGKTTVKASQPSSFWTEEVDVNADGKAETTDFLYDAQRGIVYAAWDGSFTCQNGQTANGSILEGVYAKGNKAGKPVGSGWYTVGLDEGKCGAKAAAEYGCKFDASGNPTECGVATLNDATGEIDVAVVQ
jgi:hypothetical protein